MAAKKSKKRAPAKAAKRSVKKPPKDPAAVAVSLEYHGAGVSGGQMDGRLVAQEIIGFCDFASIAAQAAYGREVTIKPGIRGFRGESFDIDFMLGVVGPLTTLLSASPTSVKEVVSLMAEAISLWKHLKGAKPNATERVQTNHNHVAVTNNSGQVQVVNIQTLSVTTDSSASAAVQAFISKPLEVAGIASVELVDSTKGKSIASISKDEALYFGPVSADQPLLESTHDTGLVIDSPSFREGNKWRFFDGQASFTASIDDEAFLGRVNSGRERFGKGDVLVVHVKQVRTADGGLRAERSILKVKEHKVAQEQYPLLSDAG